MEVVLLAMIYRKNVLKKEENGYLLAKARPYGQKSAELLYILYFFCLNLGCIMPIIGLTFTHCESLIYNKRIRFIGLYNHVRSIKAVIITGCIYRTFVRMKE